MPRLLLLAFFLLACSVQSAAAPLTGRDVARLADQADSSRDARKVMLMVINRDGSQLTRKMEMYTKKFPPDERSLIRFEAPPDIRDTSYLTWSWDDPGREDDMWVFLSSENLVRRISGGGKTGSFMRSDLANEDIEKRAVTDDAQALLREESVEGAPCWVVEYIPEKSGDSGYAKRVAWIRQDIRLPVRIDYHDKRGELLKTALYGGFSQIDDIWTYTRMRIDTPRRGSHTLIQITDVTYNTGLPDSFFEQSNLRR